MKRKPSEPHFCLNNQACTCTRDTFIATATTFNMPPSIHRQNIYTPSRSQATTITPEAHSVGNTEAKSSTKFAGITEFRREGVEGARGGAVNVAQAL